MIISHKYKFIFIKTMKTAGTSLEIFLSQHCGKEDVLTPINPHIEPHQPRNYQRKGFFNHMPAIEVQARLPLDVWDNYYKFCIERNPWDKTLSYYAMMLHRVGQEYAFEDCFKEPDFCVDAPKYTDSEGKLLVDKVIKYEELTEELTGLFNRFGIPFDGSLGVRAKSGYRNDRRHYREILTPQQAEMIAEAFTLEIDLLDYTY